MINLFLKIKYEIRIVYSLKLNDYKILKYNLGYIFNITNY